MTGTDIRETLHAIGSSVDVPSLDHAAFQGRVRRTRTRRTASRVGGAALALATVVGAAGVVSWAPWQRDATPAPSVDGGDDTGAYDPIAGLEWSPSQISFTTEGLLTITDKDDPARTQGTGIIASRVLASRSWSSYVLGDQDHVFDFAVNNDGTLFRKKDVSRAPVGGAWADGETDGVAYADESGRVLVTSPGQAKPTRLQLPDGPAPSVAALESFGDGNLVFASADGTGLRVTTPDGTHVVETGAAATDIDVAGPTIAYQTADGVQFRGLDGELRLGPVGSVLGALSPDGHSYVSVPDVSGAGRLSLVNASTGAVAAFPLDGKDPVLDVWWQNDGRFYVVTGSDTRILYDCSMSRRICQQRLVDDSGTLALPQD
jgi:hypothetical protein